MKAGFLDLLIDTFGWVCGKTFLFYFGITVGVTMAAIALVAGGALGGGSINLLSGRSLYALSFWGAFAIHFAVAFVASLWWVRSEKVGFKTWAAVTLLEAVIVTAAVSYNSAFGILAQVISGVTLSVFAGALLTGLHLFRLWQEGRWAAQSYMLESLNIARRAELTRRFGTVSTGARDLGLFD